MALCSECNLLLYSLPVIVRQVINDKYMLVLLAHRGLFCAPLQVAKARHDVLNVKVSHFKSIL